MKKRHLRRVTIILIALAVAVSPLDFNIFNASAGGAGVVSLSTAQAATKTVRLNKSSVELAAGETAAIKLLNKNGKAIAQSKIKWSSSNTAVASVSKGKITAKATGYVTVKASYNKKSYACKVSVLTQEDAELFRNIPAETADQAQRFAYMKKYWKSYGLSVDTKGLTLTWDRARALVGQDISVVKRNVRSISDCLYYMCASGYYAYSGDITYDVGTISWHFNRSPEVVFNENSGNCGGTSGLVAYLLEGDYDEVGFANYSSTSGNGGHIVNYVQNGKLFFAFDVVQFAGGYSHGLNFTSGNSLNGAAYRVFKENESKEHPVRLIYTYSGRYDGDSPIGWAYGDHTQYMIEGYFPNMNIVYDTPDEGYVQKYVSVDQNTLNKIAELRKKMWYTKDGSAREKSIYQAPDSVNTLSVQLHLKGWGYDGTELDQSGCGFGCGSDSISLTVKYNGKTITDYDLIVEDNSKGSISKQADGSILCSKAKAKGDIPFTIKYKGSELKLRWCIS